MDTPLSCEAEATLLVKNAYSKAKLVNSHEGHRFPKHGFTITDSKRNRLLVAYTPFHVYEIPWGAPVNQILFPISVA